MNKILSGVRSFQDKVFPGLAALFRGLAHGQHPRALFITCSDSRIVPHLITQTDPGDLFVIRNAGNIIPPHGKGGHSEAASIEFAVSMIGIRHIIVCGHSDCRAMHNVLVNEGQDDASTISRWLKHAEAARDEALGMKRSEKRADPLTNLVRKNVLLQLRHLKTYPCVKAALAKSEIELHAWYYKLESGEITAHDEQMGHFARIIT